MTLEAANYDLGKRCLINMMCAEIHLFYVTPKLMQDNVQVEAPQACFLVPNQVEVVNNPVKLSIEHLSLQ